MPQVTVAPAGPRSGLLAQKNAVGALWFLVAVAMLLGVRWWRGRR